MTGPAAPQPALLVGRLPIGSTKHSMEILAPLAQLFWDLESQMETAQFWAGLLKIIGADLVLSVDNAVVIALACRSLPPRQQKWGVALGAGAAVGLRIVFASFIVYLMSIPYLKLVGGILLFWVGYKLMLPEDDDKEISPAEHLWGAVRTIVIADAVMSLDNVIAVAAAADGSTVLLILGLLISIPLVIYGSRLLLVYIERYPIIVTIGAALIGYIGGEVIVSDPILAPWVEAHAPWLHFAAPMLGAVAVVAMGQFVAPRPVPVPGSAGEAVAAPLGAFAFRALVVVLGRTLALRAPVIVNVIGGAFGFWGGQEAMKSEPFFMSADWVHMLGPFVSAAAAIIVVEIVARLARQRR